jgi:hypothetical protein
MSTLLEICQSVVLECGIGDADEISTTVGQVGELGRIVHWVKQAYKELQNRSGGQWSWLRGEATFNTAADQRSYSPSVDMGLTRFKSWRINNTLNLPKIHLTSAGIGTEMRLTYTGYDSFQNIFKIGTQVSGYPSFIAEDPAHNIVLGQTPNDDYTVTCEYWKSAQVLAADGDEPELPEDFHYLLVYMAMQKYAGFEAAQEVMVRATMEASRMMRELEINQMPKWRKPRAMV